MKSKQGRNELISGITGFFTLLGNAYGLLMQVFTNT